METRLDLLSPNLVKKISQADDLMLRRIALTACNFALDRTDLKSPLIDQAKEALSGLSQMNRSLLRSQLMGLVTQLDQNQWHMKELVNLGRETMQEYLKAFCRARAANTFYYALDSNPYIAAAETVYEAYAATNDLKSLEEVIETILT